MFSRAPGAKEDQGLHKNLEGRKLEAGAPAGWEGVLEALEEREGGAASGRLILW